MNDRYLFKAKRKNWRELPKEDWWVKGALFKSVYNDRAYIIQQCKMTETFDDGMGGFDALGYEVDPSTICQCTGLKDKAGNLIFENDIIHIGDKNISYIVEWYDMGFLGKSLRATNRIGLLYWQDRIVNMGNIFDPELLEVE